MRAGDYRHRVSVLAVVESTDGHDGYVDGAPTTVRDRLAAHVVALGGRDLERAKQIDPRASHEVRLRWWTDYRAELAGGRAPLLWHDGATDRTLEIVERPREVEHRVELAMICREAA